jgi:hypothetical protein
MADWSFEPMPACRESGKSSEVAIALWTSSGGAGRSAI